MDEDDIFGKMNLLSLDNRQQSSFFSKINQRLSFNDNQEDEENEIIIVNDDKTELSQIKELDNDSRSVTESANRSRKESQMNLRENINLNLNEEKKEEEFLRPHDIKVNINKNDNNNINNIDNRFKNNNRQLDFEDLVNKKYGLFPII